MVSIAHRLRAAASLTATRRIAAQAIDKLPEHKFPKEDFKHLFNGNQSSTRSETSVESVQTTVAELKVRPARHTHCTPLRAIGSNCVWRRIHVAACWRRRA